MSYEVFIERPAQRALARISQPQQDRMISAISDLRRNPRPPGVLKLAGRPAWRIRVGDYRVIYEIDDDKSTVLVVSLGHRREVYRSGVSTTWVEKFVPDLTNKNENPSPR